MVKIKDFSRPLSVFHVFFKANLIFEDSPVYSSNFQACANTEYLIYLTCLIWFELILYNSIVLFDLILLRHINNLSVM